MASSNIVPIKNINNLEQWKSSIYKMLEEVDLGKTFAFLSTYENLWTSRIAYALELYNILNTSNIFSESYLLVLHNTNLYQKLEKLSNRKRKREPDFLPGFKMGKYKSKRHLCNCSVNCDLGYQCIVKCRNISSCQLEYFAFSKECNLKICSLCFEYFYLSLYKEAKRLLDTQSDLFSSDYFTLKKCFNGAYFKCCSKNCPNLTSNFEQNVYMHCFACILQRAHIYCEDCITEENSRLFSDRPCEMCGIVLNDDDYQIVYKYLSR